MDYGGTPSSTPLPGGPIFSQGGNLRQRGTRKHSDLDGDDEDDDKDEDDGDGHDGDELDDKVSEERDTMEQPFLWLAGFFGGVTKSSLL